MSSYEEWKQQKGVGVRTSGWTGWLIGTAVVCLIWAYFPLYLIGAAVSERMTVVPDTGFEWLVVGSLAAIAALTRLKTRPDHLPQQRSDAQLRRAIAGGEISRDQAVYESMGFRSRDEAESWLRSQTARGDEPS